MSKITRGLALAGACLAGLAVATPANAHTLKLGAVGATRASAQAPVAVNAPIRVLSPGRNGNGASSTTQSNRNRGASLQAPIAVNAPVRVLSPGRNGNGASSTTQPNRNRSASVQVPIAANAPVRVLSPGDDNADSGGTPGGGHQPEPSPGGPTVEAPVGINAPIRILSPGDDGRRPGGEEAQPGSPGGTAGGSSAGGAVAQSGETGACEMQTMSAVRGSGGSFFGAGLALFALLGTAYVGLRAAGRLPLVRWLP